MEAFYSTYGTQNINGQLAPVYTGSALHPDNALAPLYAGRGAPPPTLPAGSGGGNAGQANAMAAASQPWSIQNSPLPWLIGALVIGWIGLRYVSWRA